MEDQDIERVYETLQILPSLQQIIKQIKESNDPEQPKREVEKLIMHLSECRTLIRSLPNVDVSHDEQLRNYHQLITTFKRKRRIVKKYRLAENNTLQTAQSATQMQPLQHVPPLPQVPTVSNFQNFQHIQTSMQPLPMVPISPQQMLPLQLPSEDKRNYNRLSVPVQHQHPYDHSSSEAFFRQ